MPATFVPTKAWWKEAILYQIYPISFYDSNDDGLGDLNGIASRLDYLKELGVDVLWLSPIYRSPLADMGYDIYDYFDIDPRYGTLQDWDNLLHGVHSRGMKLIMDLVVNHTSDEHAWFKESRSSKGNAKRDWYFWRPPRYDADGTRRPPNNWKSRFQGSAWEFDEVTQEYYLHLYATQQPDLNWENPAVRAAAYDVMRFWVERGCDGFRMDVINLISKTPGLPDAPVVVPDDPTQPASMHYANGPRVHEFIQEMHREVLAAHDLITVGETPNTYDAATIAAYVLPERKELNMVFQFDLMDLDSPKVGTDYVPLRAKAVTVADIRGTIVPWQTFMREEGFWNTVFTENHDHSRAVSRFGSDAPEWRAISAKMLAVFQIGQGGTQFVYQGQELGLKNFPRSWGIEEYKDVASINYWNKILAQRRLSTGKADPDMSDVLDGFQKKARDHARVPMHWDSTANAGFTKGTPWMRVNEDYETWNAHAQAGDDTSVLAFWKKAIAMRKQSDVLIYGEFVDISNDSPSVFAFIRTLGNVTALVLLNFTKDEIDFPVIVPPGTVLDGLRHILGNYEIDSAFSNTASHARLRGYEGVIYCTA